MVTKKFFFLLKYKNILKYCKNILYYLNKKKGGGFNKSVKKIN